MSVPKCKECEHHRRLYNHSNPGGPHYCWNPENRTSKRYVQTCQMRIYASEAKTSPKWCPKRKEGESRDSTSIQNTASPVTNGNTP